MRTVNKLTKIQKRKLLDIIEDSTNSRARKRAHAIILSSQGSSIKAISELYNCDRDSVSSWLTRWEVDGMNGLYDLPRSGRPCILYKDLKKS